MKEMGLEMRFKNRELKLGNHTIIMGILNITPDSFSDGGDLNSLEKILERAKKMVEEGAEILDIGGQSTRPGHIEVSVDDEIARVVPVVEMISKKLDVLISVDTYKYQVAEAVLKAGAHIINDVWGLQRDSGEMGRIIGRYGAGVVIMHNQDNKIYEEDIIITIKKFLDRSLKIAEKNGIGKDQIMIDPGIGFGKNPQQNMETLLRMGELKEIAPILLGTSRKAVVGSTIVNYPPKERVEATVVTNTLGIERGAEIIRVHDVLNLKRAAEVADALFRK